jgi:XTP/dITP diphosphohydrolase
VSRKLQPGRLVVASHNQGKVREIVPMLAPYGIEPVSAASLGLPEPPETGTSFAANAELKAREAADLSGLPALADDSGLCVDALHGDPGIYSARWAGPDKDFGMAMRLVEQHLQEAGPEAGRDAHFICALAVAWPDGDLVTFEGRIDGTLIWPPRGTLGFGYDPMFVPLGDTRTYGEIDPAEKHATSHRARAFAQLAEALF